MSIMLKVRRQVAGFSLALLIASMFAVSVAQAATFTDVQPSDWFYPYVEDLAAKGILNTSFSAYRPGDLVNRAEMAKLAVEAWHLTLETPTTAPFKDVSLGQWYTSYIYTAQKNNIVGGYKDTNGTLTGYFGPGDNVTREQAIKILALAAPLATNTNGGPHFPDVALSAWSYEYVESGYNWSVVDGYPDGNFKPGNSINRAEIAKMVSNAMTPVVRPGSSGFKIDSVTALNATSVEVCFATPVDATEAAVESHYSIKDSSNSVLAVDTATVSTDGMCVDLETATQTSATVYTLVITGVNSESGEVLPSNSIGFNGYSVNATGGDLTVSADSSTPAGITLPGAVSGVPVFTFDVSAGTDDVTISSIELHRAGTGVDASVTNVAIFDENTRVSKAKTFNSSTDTATVSLLAGGLVVKAGETKKLTVVATVGTAAAANGSEFAIEVAKAGAIASNASQISGTFAVTGNTFKVGSTDGGIITWKQNGKPSDPKLGAVAAEVSKFKLTNESNDNSMMLNGVTIKQFGGSANVDTDLENFSLWIEGTKVAETAKSSAKYITFKLSTPYEIKSSKTISLVMKADLIDGAGRTLIFNLDNTLDLSATDSKFGYGAKVCYDNADATCAADAPSGTGIAGSYDTQTITIQAGEVSIVSTDADKTDILKNKKNIVAGTLKITTKAGLNLEVQKLGVTVTNGDAAASANAATTCSVATGTYDSALDCLIENVELYDTKTGSVYDLPGTPAATAKTFTYADSSVTIPLVAGETREFQVRFDTLNRNITGAQLNFALNNIGATGTSFYLVETNNNQAVTDITPSSISYKTLNGVAATATINVLTQSATKTAVVGSKEVEVLSSQIDAGNASSLHMTEFSVYGQWVNHIGPVTGNATNATVNTLYLYKVATDGTKTLLKQKSGSTLAAGVITFDGLDETIEANKAEKLLVTADIVDDSTKATDTLQFGIQGIRLADYDNDDVLAATLNGVAVTDITNPATFTPATPAYSARVVTISGVGTLAVAVKNDDSATNYAKNIVGGTTSDFVETLEFTAQNEPILVKDLSIVSTPGTIAASVSDIVLYKADKTTEIARKSVTGTTTTFVNLNYTIALGSERIYVKVVAHKIGKDQPGATGTVDYTLAANVTKADGGDSSKTVAGLPIASTGGPNFAFHTHAVKVSNISFVNTATVNSVTATVPANLAGGSANNIIAIIAVATDPSTNTNTATGGAIQTQLKTFNFNIAGTAGTSDDVSVERLGGSGDTISGGVAASDNGGAGALITNVMTCVDTTPADGICDDNGMALQNWNIANGTVAYYVVRAINHNLTTGSAQVKFTALGTQVLFTTDQAGTPLAAIGVRMAASTIDGPSLTYNP